MSDPTINLTLSIFAFACLRGLIQREIDQVERHRRVLGVTTTPADRDLTDAYLRQLKAALAPVEAVYADMGAT